MLSTIISFKYAILILLVGIICSPVYAQKDISINFEFSNQNDQRWLLGSNSRYEASISEDGIYRFQSKDNDLTQRVDGIVMGYEEEDFELSIRMRSTFCGDDDYYGFYLGRKFDETDYLAVYMSWARDYKIAHKKGDNQKKIQDWKENDAIHQRDEWQLISFSRKDEKMTLKVNGVVFNEFKDEYPEFSQIGFVIGGNSTIEVDYARITFFDRMINEVSEDVLSGEKESLGSAINTTYAELRPTLSIDGKKLYFIRSDMEVASIGKGEYDSFWESELVNDKWQDATLVRNSTYFNSDENRVGMDMSADGNTFYTLGIYKSNEFVDNGISSIKKNYSQWGQPIAMRIKNYTLYDKGELANVRMLADGKTILLGLNSREGDDYFMQLYVCFLEPDGSWTSPKNLGQTINKGGRVYSPFMAADGKTLYFSTSGYPGYGEIDYFVSKRLDDTWTNWSEPKNLGPKINGEGWDGHLVMPAIGNYAYMTSDGINYSEDLYRVGLPKEAQPEPVELITGRVFDSKTNNPIAATISLRDLDTDKEVAVATTNASTGMFKMVLPTGKNYAFFAKKEGYYSVRENASMTELKKYTESSKDLFLSPIEIGQAIKLNNIFFKRAKAEILPKSFPELHELVKILKENPSLRIRIEGHTDNQGLAELNWKLSQERADVIYKFLTSNGIKKKRLEAKGFGPSRPVVDNDNPALRQLNRRVVFVIIE